MIPGPPGGGGGVDGDDVGTGGGDSEVTFHFSLLGVGDAHTTMSLARGIHSTLAMQEFGPFAQTHQKVAGVCIYLGSEPLHAGMGCQPVRRIYKREKRKADQR